MIASDLVHDFPYFLPQYLLDIFNTNDLQDPSLSHSIVMIE